MSIHGFIERYCKDIIRKNAQKTSLIDMSSYQYDDIIVDEDGVQVPVVYIDGTAVPVQDFFCMDKDDFCKAYVLPSAGEVYDSYLSAYIILEGEEALNEIRNAIRAEADRLNSEVNLSLAW